MRPKKKKKKSRKYRRDILFPRSYSYIQILYEKAVLSRNYFLLIDTAIDIKLEGSIDED